MVERVRCDGKFFSFADERFHFRGVTYGTFAPRTDGERYPERAQVNADFAQLASADPRARLVAACDKLHNLRTLIADLRRDGPVTLERFTASPERTRWYYESAHSLLRDALPAAQRAEFDAAIEALRGFVARAEAP